MLPPDYLDAALQDTTLSPFCHICLPKFSYTGLAAANIARNWLLASALIMDL